jgi:hypothetical protein
MLDWLSTAIPDAQQGFRLLFSVQPFEGQQATFSWVRADSVEGNWYRSDETGVEGWLCPALFWYFPEAPPKLFVRAEPRAAKHAEPLYGLFCQQAHHERGKKNPPSESLEPDCG